MKTKRNARKNRMTCNNSVYTLGYNMFGEKAETHLVVLKRETALQQVLDCICQLDGTTKEFTFDMSCFNGHEDEITEIMEKVKILTELKAKASHKAFYDCSDWLEEIA